MDGVDVYIWRRRIHHGVRYQKSAVPFPRSVQIGLEFNAALERREKLDPSLLTNAVMLELCDFARTVTKSEKYFLFEMLEFNFDLGVDVGSDVQCYDYATRVHGKVRLLKDQIRLKPRRWNETFLLPRRDPSKGSGGAERAGCYCPKKNKMVDSSLLSDGSRRPADGPSDGAASGEINGRGRGIAVKRAGGGYPHCRELGVTLMVQPGAAPPHKLDPGLMTNGVAMELLDFSRVLCGNHTGMIRDLVLQNFGQELEKVHLRVQISRLMERRDACLSADDRDAFRKERFQTQNKKQEPNRAKRPKVDADHHELERVTTSEFRRDDEAPLEDGELSYMCPLEFEADPPADTEIATGNTPAQSVLSGETKCAARPAPQTNGCRSASSRPTNALQSVSSLFFEDRTGTAEVKTPKQKLWVRRAPRSKLILKSSRVNDLFARCRQIALDFNVGSGNRQKVDLQLLNNKVMWEIHKFASLMKSLNNFLLDILDNNFELVLQDEQHQRRFILFLMSKEKFLASHPARLQEDFLSRRLQFPEAYRSAPGSRTGPDAGTQRHVHGDPPAVSGRPGVDKHPFCDRLGVDLWSTEPAGQKLHLSVMTAGALLEIFSFARELCGTVRETVIDVLEHNFDVEQQSRASHVLQRWFLTQRSLAKGQTASPKTKQWFSKIIPLSDQSEPSPPAPTADPPEHPGSEKRADSFRLCSARGLQLDVRCKPQTKLDPGVLTRGVLVELHRYVRQNHRHYVPALYAILEHNFDLSSQVHRKVEFAWSIAAQVIAVAAKNGRSGAYLNQVFQLPFELPECLRTKEEPRDGFTPPDLGEDVVFVRELKAVDIEVTVD